MLDFPEVLKRYQSTVLHHTRYSVCSRGYTCIQRLLTSSLRHHWSHDDVIKWKQFPRYHSPMNSPHKSKWRGALLFSVICALNSRLGKQSWGWWFETSSRSLWRHCNVAIRNSNWIYRWYLEFENVYLMASSDIYTKGFFNGLDSRKYLIILVKDSFMD